MQVYQRYPNRFNIVHVACALSCLADKTAARLTNRQVLQVELSALRAFVGELLEVASNQLPSIDTATAAALLHSLARLAKPDKVCAGWHACARHPPAPALPLKQQAAVGHKEVKVSGNLAPSMCSAGTSCDLCQPPVIQSPNAVAYCVCMCGASVVCFYACPAVASSARPCVGCCCVDPH